MFVVEFFARGSVPSARDVLADSVAEAEGYSEQRKQGCKFYNWLHWPSRYCDQR
jgi:hypothetical protein